MAFLNYYILKAVLDYINSTVISVNRGPLIEVLQIGHVC